MNKCILEDFCLIITKLLRRFLQHEMNTFPAFIQEIILQIIRMIHKILIMKIKRKSLKS
jgi:hypothetical protein